MKTKTVYAIIEVTFDYYRFENFKCIASSEKEAYEVAEKLDHRPIYSHDPVGETENDSIGPHIWICPEEIVIDEQEIKKS